MFYVNDHSGDTVAMVAVVMWLDPLMSVRLIVERESERRRHKERDGEREAVFDPDEKSGPLQRDHCFSRESSSRFAPINPLSWQRASEGGRGSGRAGVPGRGCLPTPLSPGASARHCAFVPRSGKRRTRVGEGGGGGDRRTDSALKHLARFPRVTYRQAVS